jgi:osmotically-inducible protein OsmY
MKSDPKLRIDVLEELTFDPSVYHENLSVAANDGVVTLSGSVPTYADKYAAEKAAFRVSSVKAIADEIEVRLAGRSMRTDQEIAKAASDALSWHVHIPETVRISVEDGVVNLRGDVEWQFQRDAANAAMRYLKGIKGLKNRIKIRKSAQPSDIKERIEGALVRGAEDDAHKIMVTTTNDGTVVLTGKVRSRAEMEDARWAAWAAPGVVRVENNLTVD